MIDPLPILLKRIDPKPDKWSKVIINLDEFYALVKEYEAVIEKVKAFRLKMGNGAELTIDFEKGQR